MPRFNGESLQIPLLAIWAKFHEKTSKWMWEPMISFNNWLLDLPDADLWMCGFGAIVILIESGIFFIFLAIQVKLFFMELNHIGMIAFLSPQHSDLDCRIVPKKHFQNSF